MLHKRAIGFLLVFSSLNTYADLPLTVEDLLTEKSQFRLEAGINYANSDRRDVNARFDLVQAGAEGFVLLPVDVNSQRQNSDTFIFTFGTRYGITSKTELYNRIIATADNTRIQNESETQDISSTQWNDIVLGINHQFSEENATPALLIFAELTALENATTDRSDDVVYGNSGQIGFTTYRSIDPIVLSLTAGYRYVGSRSVNEESIDPGDLGFFKPSLGFAVNNEVTITGGVQFKYRDSDKVEGETVDIKTTQTDMDFGVGYAINEALTLNFSISSDITGDRGAQAGFNILYKINN